MANRNAPATFTFEEWRVEFNELSDDIGDFESGVVGSIPASTPTYNTVESAIQGLVGDVNNIMNGTYSFSGATTTITQDLQVNGDATVDGSLTVNGNLILGNQDTDSVTIAADLASNLIPDLDNTYDIGSIAKSWKDLFIDGTATIGGSASIASVSGSTSVSSGALVVGGGVGIGENLNVGGTVISSGAMFENGDQPVANEGFAIAVSIALS